MLFSRVACKPLSFDWLCTKEEIKKYDSNKMAEWNNSIVESPISLGMYAFPYGFEEPLLIPMHHFGNYFSGQLWFHVFKLQGEVKIYHKLHKDVTVTWKSCNLKEYNSLFKTYIKKNYKKILNDDVVQYKHSIFEIIISGCNMNIIKMFEYGEGKNIKFLPKRFLKEFIEMYPNMGERLKVIDLYGENSED